MAQPQTLESLVTRYRRAASDTTPGAPDIELEIRFHNVEPPVFLTVLDALVAKKLPASVECTVNSIMDEVPAEKAHGKGNARASLIRQIKFDAQGRRAGEQYYRKYFLAPPHRVRTPHALGYSVLLSAEEKLPAPFTSDSGSIMRVKARASFLLEDNTWRADLTIVRTLTGTNAASLPHVVAKMFRSGTLTPSNMAAVLDLSNPATCALYDFEIELERLPLAADQAKPSEIISLASSVLSMANPEYLDEAAYQAEIYHVAHFVAGAPGILQKFKHEWGLKQLTPQVTALSQVEYQNIYPPTGYYLLDKADGVRAIASVRDGRLFVLADGLLRYGGAADAVDATATAATTATTATAATARPNVSNLITPTIVDGELVRGKKGDPPVFYAFDVIAVKGENLAAQGYEARASRIAETVEILREAGIDAHAKPVVHLSATEPEDLKVQFNTPLLKNRPYETDGLILVESGKPYNATSAYKWKPLHNITIDFLVRRAPAGAPGRPKHTLYYLFVGISADVREAFGLDPVAGYRELFGDVHAGYMPIQFSPSGHPLAYMYYHPSSSATQELDGKVAEMRWVDSSWVLVRVRADRSRDLKSGRYYGNDYRIAELTWMDYMNPLTEEHLWNGPAVAYFATEKSPMYRAQTSFTSYIKSQRIASLLSLNPWVIDAAIGKGQDLGRLMQAKVRNVVGIDYDAQAIAQLVQRKHSHTSKRLDDEKKNPTSLYVIQADLRSPQDALTARVRSITGFPGGAAAGGKEGADALVINLAIHYLAGDIAHIRNFAVMCRNLVKVEGHVVITAMFGNRVHELFRSRGIKTGGTWDARQDGVMKYSFRRDYAADTLTDAGQKIGVVLPFSKGTYYEEYLVNVDTLVAEFAARGFVLVEKPSFEESFREFRTRSPAVYAQLTPDDLTFLSLYGEVIFRRTK